MPTRRSSILWIFAIIAVSVAVYLPSMGGGFLLDDWGLIVEDPTAHSLKNIPRAFTTDFLKGTLGTALAYYRPLVTISYQINYAISGPNATAFRFTNVLLSALAAVMLFLIARRMTKSTFAAGIAGLAFTALPSHAESVAWISGRTDIISTLFIAGSLLCFAAGYARRPNTSWGWSIMCSLLFLCALLSKENALIFPALLLAYVWVFGERPNRSDVIRWALITIPPILVFLLLRKHVLGISLCDNLWVMLKERLLCVGVAYAAYLRMMFVPQQVQILYDVFPAAIKYPIVAYGAWLIPPGLLTLAVWTRKKVPVISFGALWILITVLPVTNLLPTIGPLPAERFVYLPSIGSSIILGWLAWRLYSFRPRSKYSIPDPINIWPVIIALIICFFVLNSASLLIIGSQYYTSDIAWAKAVTATDTRFPIFRAAAAKIYADTGLLDEALREYETVLALRQNDLTDYVGLAGVYRKMKDPEKALEVIEQSKNEIGPNAPLEYHTGIAYAEMGDMKKAESAFERAVDLNPKLAPAWRNLGKARFEQGKFPQAVEAYKQALKLAQPGSEFAKKVQEELQKTVISYQ